MLIQNTSILFPGHLNISEMYCERGWQMNLSHSYTIAKGHDEICASEWETFQEVTVKIRVPSTSVKRFVNQQILKEKIQQHSITL